jgi:hypothetical protein
MVDVKMADNSMVGSLFGVDPAQYQQQQALLQSNQNMQLAQLDPLQSARYSLMQGGSQLGNVGQQLLGIQDPQLQQATELKQIASQYDTTTPQGLMALAQAVQGKYPAQAQRAVEAAQKMQLNAANVYQKTGENLNSLISSGKYTPESLSKYQQTRNAGDLVPLIAPEKMGETTIKEIATAEKNNTILTNSNAKLDGLIKEVEAGDIQFGLGPRAVAIGQRFTGKQDENTRKLDSLSKFMETERNNILLAAKGTQTEGDATRAMNQIIKDTDLNNQESVAQALRDLKAYKESQIVGNNAYISALQGSRKLGGTSPQVPPSGEYADDYKKYVAKYGNVLPYAAYAAKRKQAAQ